MSSRLFTLIYAYMFIFAFAKSNRHLFACHFCDIEMHYVHSIGNFFSFEIANSIWHSYACRNKESYACTNMLSPFIGGSVKSCRQNYLLYN